MLTECGIGPAGEARGWTDPLLPTSLELRGGRYYREMK